MTQSDGMDLHERRWKLMAGVLPAGPGQQPPPFVVIGPPIPPDEMVEVVEVRTPTDPGAVSELHAAAQNFLNHPTSSKARLRLQEALYPDPRDLARAMLRRAPRHHRGAV